MENKEISSASSNSVQFNKIGYAGMFISGIILLILKDYSTATVMIALALVFDPFNPEVSFGKRPLWQRLWLISHLVFVLVVFGIEITR